MNVEFEYVVTNEELEIDKIVAQRRRKKLVTASCQTFEALGKQVDEPYQGGRIDVVIHAGAKRNGAGKLLCRFYKRQHPLYDCVCAER